MRPSDTKGGKFSLEIQNEKNKGSESNQFVGGTTTDFGSEAGGFKFDRQQRVNVFPVLPDYNNVLFHKDKGKSYKPPSKGFQFNRAKGGGAQECDPKKIRNPGPGSYQENARLL